MPVKAFAGIVEAIMLALLGTFVLLLLWTIHYLSVEGWKRREGI
jgi:hypothetical protein